MAWLWPLISAATSVDFGRPTLERNHLRKFTTQSTHISDEIPQSFKDRLQILRHRTTPARADLPTRPVDQLKIITNAHDSREKLHPLTNELSPMFVVGTGQRILPAKIRPSHAPIDAVNHLNLSVRQDIPPIRASHVTLQLLLHHRTQIPTTVHKSQPPFTKIYILPNCLQ